MTKEKECVISQGLIVAIIDYLKTKPYNEVIGIIRAIEQNVKLIEQKAPQPEKTEASSESM